MSASGRLYRAATIGRIADVTVTARDLLQETLPCLIAVIRTRNQNLQRMVGETGWEWKKYLTRNVHESRFSLGYRLHLLQQMW